jgi:hypothetical protein
MECMTLERRIAEAAHTSGYHQSINNLINYLILFCSISTGREGDYITKSCSESSLKKESRFGNLHSTVNVFAPEASGNALKVCLA